MSGIVAALSAPRPRKPLVLRRAATITIADEVEWEWEENGKWITIFDPIRTTAPASARPFCCLGHVVIFYDASNQELDRGRYHDLNTGSSMLLRIDGQLWEIVSGRVRWERGGWCMGWSARPPADQTRYALRLPATAVTTDGQLQLLARITYALADTSPHFAMLRMYPNDSTRMEEIRRAVFD